MLSLHHPSTSATCDFAAVTLGEVMGPLPNPGMLVGSNVRLKSVLGRGGMGSIWLAEHLSLEIDVAVKFLSPELASLPEAKARFEREAATVAQLKNPHVVKIFDRGVTPDGLPYIVMELLEGEDLARHIDRLGPLPLEEVALVVYQVSRALSGAHAMGMVHRDIKPDNIFLIDADGELFVKVLDFGIAKRIQDRVLNVTSETSMMGTPHYMSPEQIVSPRDVDFRSDCWALAAVAYTALTGRVPFDGETMGALCVAVNAGEFEPVTRWRPSLPPALDRWFERAFQRDPAARFASIQDMATAFDLCAGTVSGGPSSSTRPRGERFSSVPSYPGLPAERTSATPLPGTFQGASITNPKAPKNSRWLTFTLVVALSMVCSAVTTVLVMMPSGRTPTIRPLSAAAGTSLPDAFTSSREQALTTNPPPQPSSSSVASLLGTASSAPNVEFAPAHHEAVEIQASKTEAAFAKQRTPSNNAKARPKAKPRPRATTRPPSPPPPDAPERVPDYGL